MTALAGTDAALRERARRVIPGGMWGHLNAARLPQGYDSLVGERGQGQREQDEDGKFHGRGCEGREAGSGN